MAVTTKNITEVVVTMKPTLEPGRMFTFLEGGVTRQFKVIKLGPLTDGRAVHVIALRLEDSKIMYWALGEFYALLASADIKLGG